MNENPTTHGPAEICRSKVLLVDDHPIVLEGLAVLLNREADLHVEWTASTGAEGLKLCEQHAPDLAIVDVSLPDMSGMELVRAMRERRSPMPILVMSMHDEAIYAERAIRAGARGYIMKQTAAKHIVQAIRRILSGDTYLSKSIVSSLVDRLSSGKAGGRPSSFAGLSDRELEVFQLIGMGLTKAQIADKLGRSANTVEAHRASIKRKLNVASSAALARVAFLYNENGPRMEHDVAAP